MQDGPTPGGGTHSMLPARLQSAVLSRALLEAKPFLFVVCRVHSLLLPAVLTECSQQFLAPLLTDYSQRCCPGQLWRPNPCGTDIDSLLLAPLLADRSQRCSLGAIQKRLKTLRTSFGQGTVASIMW